MQFPQLSPLRQLGVTTWVTATLLVGCSTPSVAPIASNPALACRALQGQSIGQQQATITEATLIPQGDGMLEHCRVVAALTDSALRFDVRLPTSGWNGRFLALGGGGFKGEIFVPTRPNYSASVTRDGWATMATNGGYDFPQRDAEYFRAEFAYDTMKLADYTYLSIHRSLPLAKEVLQLYYGKPAQRHYFEGCSAGGHEGMMLSQRFPADFDGIIARAPAGNFPGLFLQFNRFSKAQRAAGGQLNESKQTLLAQAVLQHCDAADGLRDGIVSNPRSCNFNPAVLRCTGGADTGNQCLSDAQINTVLTATSEYRTAKGQLLHAGVNWGGEDHRTKGWGEYLWPWPQAPFSGESVATRFSDGFIRSFVVREGGYDTLQFNPDQWSSTLSLLGQQFGAFNPDLSAYRARGGKLILWNGEQDTAVSSRETARYTDAVVQRLGQSGADEVLETYLAPGVGHCSGGTGPDRIELLRAMVQWVEHGVAPSRQNLTHNQLDASGTPIVTRPACKYPTYPRYKGSGDPNKPDSFVCSAS